MYEQTVTLKHRLKPKKLIIKKTEQTTLLNHTTSYSKIISSKYGVQTKQILRCDAIISFWRRKNNKIVQAYIFNLI